MFWESYLCEQQSDEIVPEEYFDWCAWVYGGAFREEEEK